MDQINVLKEKGNAALTAENFDEAISAYSEAIKLDSSNHVLYSNRSAAFCKAGKYEEALNDANETINVSPKWPKGFSRKGAALSGMQKYTEALAAYKKGLELDPQNTALLQAQSDVQNILLNQLLGQVPMDIDPSSPFAPEKTSNTATRKTTPSTKSESRSTMPQKSDEDDNLPENKKMAKQSKNLGNECYKKKSFEEAIHHYQAAVDHDPTDITFYSNIAAVYFERKEYDKCIAECEKGIEIGRENRADFKLIAKAFARIGNAYRKLENWGASKINLEKSLSEYRTPEVKTQLSEVEKKMKESEIKAYIDPVKAEEEKELGNKLFKKGDFGTAIKHYSEAIRRNPDDPRLYSNRAACYTKLAAFDLGLKDCETCTSLDEKFIKGWIRKGKILQGMQQASKALGAYQKAIEIDPNNAEALDGYRSCTVAVNTNPQEVWKRAMADPEVQQILKDPAMRVILEQMQSDPKAVHDHLKNPDIAGKIQKLLESGIIQIH